MTRIVAVELRTLRIPLVDPLASAHGRISHHAMGLLRVFAGDGSEGLGEVVGQPPAGAAAQLGSELTGLEVTDAGSMAPALDPALGAAVESAILDLVARSRGRSAASLLGGAARTDVAINGLIGRVPPGEAAARAVELLAEGFGCLKVKGGGEPWRSVLDRLAAARGAVGPGVALRLDLNGSLDPDTADVALASLRPFDLEYVEQPLPVDVDVAGLARLRRRSGVPTAADESVTGLAAARALLDNGAVDVLVVKPSRVGGLAAAHAIATEAAEAGLSATISTLLESGVGLAGALQVASLVPGDRAHGLATASFLASDLLAAPLPIQAGRMAVPAGTGLGIELDRAAVERWTVT